MSSRHEFKMARWHGQPRQRALLLAGKLTKRISFLSYNGSMDKQPLLETLAKLHAELAHANHVDPEAADMLRMLTVDIERVLNQPSAASPAEVQTASGGLKDLLLKFEAEHPELSTAIGKVADTLSAMGI